MTIYQSRYQGSEVDNTLDKVNSDSARVHWGNIIGTLSDQADLNRVLSEKALKATTINGKSLSTNITLDYSDVHALSESTKYGRYIRADEDGNFVKVELTAQDGTKLDSARILTYNTTKMNSLLNEKLSRTDYLSLVYNSGSHGDPMVPVYFRSDGKAYPITSYSGTAARAERADCDRSGREISATYVARSEYANKGNETTPIYFDRYGNPMTITSYNGTAKRAESATTAQNADNDGRGININASYVRLADSQTITGHKTFTSSDLGALTVKRTGGAQGAASIKYYNDNTLLGTLGIASNSIPLWTSSDFGDAKDLVRNQQHNTAVGGVNLPVYIDSSGIAQTIESYGGTANYAIHDNLGNIISETYQRNPEGAAPAVDPKLSNLSPEGEERLHSLKSYLDEGECITDSEGLQDVLSYAYSTFDSSKFNLEGNISNSNGVISKFSRTSYATCDLSNFEYSSSLEIIFSVNITDTPLPSGGARQWIFNNGLQSGNYKGFNISLENDSKLRVFAGTGSSWDVFNQVKGSHVFVPGKYFLKIEVDQTSSICTIYYSTDKINWVREIQGTTPNIIPINFVHYFGYGGTTNVNSFLGSINLKEFSVYLDGSLVFSGIQSGIDVVKENNYTIKGSPVINANGIVSNLSNSNFCELTSPTFALTDQNNWVIETPIYYISPAGLYSSMDSIFNFPSSLNVVSIFLSIRDTGKFEACIRNKANNADVIRVGAEATGTTKFPNNMERLQVRFEHDAGLGEYKISYSINKGEWFVAKSVTDTASEVNANSTISFGRNMVEGCSMDLNSFKVYVDGNLVYQPCLRIPYFLSNSNSKIVDQFYKNRVDDLYSQQNSANYFTLSEVPVPNYLIYSSTRVSSDYIADYFDSDSYVRCYINLTNNDRFIIKGRFKGVGPEGDGTIISMDGVNAGVTINTSSSSATISGTVGGPAYKSTVTLSNYDSSSWYEYIFEYSGTYNQLKVKKETDLVYASGTPTAISGVPFTYKVVDFGVANPGSTASNIFNGYIDLKAFKIYKNNVLAYQTVIEPNYTLPQGNLYGLISSTHNLDSIEVSNSYYPLGDASRIISDSSELGTNWNNYTAPGTYKIQNLTFSSADHSPMGELNSGMLYVMKLRNGIDTDDRTVQMYFPNGASDNISGTRGGICIREKNGSTWYDWKQICTKAANDLTYAAIAGNQTIEGLKTFASDTVGGALEVKKTGSTSGAALIKFSDENTTFGYLGVNNDSYKTPIWYNWELASYQKLIRGPLNDPNPIGSQYIPVYVDETSTVNACSVLNKTSVGSLGFTDTTTGQKLVNQNSIAYWDGRYNDQLSNLRYCYGANGNEIVGTANNQTITGTKTFAGNGTIKIGNSSGGAVLAALDNSTFIRRSTNGALVLIAAQDTGLLLKPNGDNDSTTQANINNDGSLGLNNHKVTMKYNSTIEALEFTFE